jgi:hypothetical protein
MREPPLAWTEPADATLYFLQITQQNIPHHNEFV